MTKTGKERWLLSQRPRKFKVSVPKAAYAVAIVMAADSDMLAQVREDVNEMIAGVSESVSVLLLIDLPGDSGASVVEITPEGTRPLMQMPEISTGDPVPLAAFFARALVSYSPKTRFALGFWGHGKGVFGDNDPNEVVLPAALMKMPMPPRAPRPRRRPLAGAVAAFAMLPDDHSGDVLTNREAHSALSVAFARAGRSKPVDMIFSDTCLNGAVEVYTELREFAQTVVASSLLIPAGGWNYKTWLGMTSTRSPGDAKAWAELAVEAYEEQYPQVDGLPPAQLAAFSTSAEHDLVKTFAKVVKALSDLKDQRRLILGNAARRVQSIQYPENLDLEQLVYEIRRLAEEDSPLWLACREFLRTNTAATIAISQAPENGEMLSGLTIWCPVRGDLKGVGRRYSSLDFSKKTKWLKLLKDIEKDKVEAERASGA